MIVMLKKFPFCCFEVIMEIIVVVKESTYEKVLKVIPNMVIQTCQKKMNSFFVSTKKCHLFEIG